MNIAEFTQKSIQVVDGCERLAYEYGNQEIAELTTRLATIDYYYEADLNQFK